MRKPNTTEEVVAYQGSRAKNIADADSMFGAQAKGGKPSGPPAGGGAAARSAPSGGGRSAPAPSRQAGRQAKGKEAAPQKKKARKKSGGNAIIRILMGFGMSLVIAVIGSIAIAIILIQMLEAGLIPPGNRNPIVFGTFILLFFGTAFMYLNKHFNLMSAFKSQPQAKKVRHQKPFPLQNRRKRKQLPEPKALLIRISMKLLCARPWGMTEMTPKLQT